MIQLFQAASLLRQSKIGRVLARVRAQLEEPQTGENAGFHSYRNGLQAAAFVDRSAWPC